MTLPRESLDPSQRGNPSRKSLAARDSLESKKFLAWPLDADRIHIKYKLELRMTGIQVTKTLIK
jgi:hypothetical protein